MGIFPTMFQPMLGRSIGDAEATQAFRQCLHEAMLDIGRQHGPGAFLAPRQHAAVHETGHIISYILDGFSVVSVRVQRGWVNGEETWGGRTMPDREVPGCGPDLDIANDLLAVRQHLAGWVCEKCFLDDVKPGSSLDEIIFAEMICTAIGAKTNRDPRDVKREACEQLDLAFQANETTINAIADALMREKVLRGRRLAALLKNIVKPGE